MRLGAKSVACTTATESALEFRPKPINFGHGFRASGGMEPGQDGWSGRTVPRVVTPTFLY